jgi:nitrite reductase/ring-hydroxylating ferredoxin subunit
MDRHPDAELHTIPPDRGVMEEQPKWRRDFPIDTVQDGYVARREFTKFLGLTSLAFVAGQVWIALQNRWRKSRGQLPLLALGRLDELPVGQAITFYYPTDTDPALLLRLDLETFVAYGSQCTHLQCPVLPAIDSGRLHCPCHAGFFDLMTGRPTAGPPRRALPRILVQVRAGTIYASGIEESVT